MNNSNRIFCFLLLISSLSFGGCGVNLLSKSDDIALGQKMQAQIAADPAHYPVLNNPTVTGYIQGIVNSIVASPNVKNKDFRYVATVIKDDNTVNAFAVPGGPIYVYTGLLKFIDNEATLAGILAHEITHVDHRHSSEQITQQYGLQILSGIVVGQTANNGLLSEIVQYTAAAGGQLASLRFSRNDERDADKTSFEDLLAIPGRPWYPAGIKYFMIKTVPMEGKGSSGLAKNFSTHPPSQERLDAVNKQAKDVKLPEPTETQLKTTELQRIKSML